MKRYLVIMIGILSILLSSGCSSKEGDSLKESSNDKIIKGLVIYQDEDKSYVALDNQSIYIFEKIGANVNDYVDITYEGDIDNTKDYQKISILKVEKRNDEYRILGLNNSYDDRARDLVNKMSLERIVGSLFMPHHTSNSLEDVSKYHLGGLVLFGESFKNKTREDILKMIEELQSRADYPLFLAVDEEGGSVVRVSSNRNLKVKSFSSPRSLYIEGGFELIRRDNEEKNELLKSLGLNINLAPVLDISIDKSDYIYYRSIGLSPELTGEFAKVIIESSKDSGIVNVMKHYPGYGKNKDTHKTSSLDTRSKEEVERDLGPFKRAILSGAEAIMISHNTVEVLDSLNPASISINNHNYLRNTLDFRGMVITDALNMGATADIEDIGLKAILAGNNIIITKNYVKNIEEIINYVKAGNLSEEYLKALAVKVIAWKIKMGLIK